MCSGQEQELRPILGEGKDMKSGNKSAAMVRLLMLLVAIGIVATATIVWAAGGDRDDRRDDDRDGWRSSQSHNDDDWDDHDNFHRRDRYAIGLWGDMPYSDEQASVGVPNLINDMNSHNLAFTAHDGDLKAGSVLAGSITPVKCDAAKYNQALGFLNALKAPAVFTPGDNDWTDCDNGTAATSNGPYNSLERLDFERSFFFSGAYANKTAGQHQMHQAVQGVTPGVDATPCKGFVHGIGTLDVNGNGLDTDQWKDVPCKENRRWTYRGITYATLNVQGSCNNRCKDHPDDVEWAARNTADINWMKETFQVAKDRNSAAVMLIVQADVGFNDRPAESEPNRDPKTLICNTTGINACTASTKDGFQSLLTELRTQVIGFGKPVAWVHGDSHIPRIDKPFLDSKGLRIENFTRIETFGDNVVTTDPTHPDLNDVDNIHWVKVFVNPESNNVFLFQDEIVQSNQKLVTLVP
jgi:hypothetical protein